MGGVAVWVGVGVKVMDCSGYAEDATGGLKVKVDALYSRLLQSKLYCWRIKLRDEKRSTTGEEEGG
eukprot:CAMPEP_0184352758 /NCGR_PEP_ID=MMETSP1089-20130417/70152_1 /TAXON_ID=38269 ORGANISM="Gloeochaete wittrockiana, Strain SAG46.84" /NCGR_SAMPLE_ID=MMETSP1089 /ASSEMBLY_ACC=CAM_ASM_000445 /LENGTH=65 /DNA_ID=CAMNT_0026687605 /DNA_START=35 /DNA_END=232 /DNA_ORIENTATION=+